MQEQANKADALLYEPVITRQEAMEIRGNESGAKILKEKILEAFQKADIKIYKTNGLCSFYAEKGGLLVGYDTI